MKKTTQKKMKKTIVIMAVIMAISMINVMGDTVTPMSRTSERINYSNGTSVIRIYTTSTPHYYKQNGVLLPINLTIATKGVKYVSSKNIVSSEISPLSSYFLTLSPDENSSQRINYKIESLIFDGKKQSQSLIPTKINKSNIEFNNMVFKFDRWGQKQFIKSNNTVKSILVNYTLKLDNLTVQEKYGEFWFYDNSGKFRFKIRKPYIADEKFKQIGYFEGFTTPLLNHSLNQNKDGTYTYLKFTTDYFTNVYDKLPKSYYIDADTYYSSTADGYGYHESFFGSWAAVHDATDGTSVDTTALEYTSGAWAENFGDMLWFMSRLFFYFDTSGATNPSAVDLKIYGSTNANSNVAAQKGTQADTLGTADWDSFTGSEYGHTNWAINAYNTISFNAQGIADINVSGTTKICAREYTHDYLNSDPGAGNFYKNGVFFAEETGTSKDPYLEITEGVSDTCTCPQSWATNWTINMADNCDITTACIAQAVNCYNTGTLRIFSTISTKDFRFCDNVDLYDGGIIDIYD